MGMQVLLYHSKTQEMIQLLPGRYLCAKLNASGAPQWTLN